MTRSIAATAAVHSIAGYPRVLEPFLLSFPSPNPSPPHLISGSRHSSVTTARGRGDTTHNTRLGHKREAWSSILSLYICVIYIDNQLF